MGFPCLHTYTAHVFKPLQFLKPQKPTRKANGHGYWAFPKKLIDYQKKKKKLTLVQLRVFQYILDNSNDLFVPYTL